MATALPAVKGAAFTFYTSLVSQLATDTYQAAPTLAAGDVLVIKDGTLAGNITALPVAVASATRVLAVALTAAEMDADSVTVLFHDVAGNEWQDWVVSHYTAAQTLDATAAAVASLGSGTGAALNFAADADNTGAPLKGVTFVGSQANVFGDTASENGTRHSITDSGSTPDIDIVYQFSIGAGRNASKVVWKGYVTNGDTVTVQAYNGATWDTRATILGVSGTNNFTRDIPLLAPHTGTGADAGKVFIRFTCSSQSSIVVHTDELLVAGVSVGLTTGYADGAVWVKASGASGITPYINGTADNPTSWANAQTIATAVGLTRFRIINGETVTLTGATANKSLIGKNWNLAMAGQSISGSYIEGASVSGIGTGAAPPMFKECWINAMTLCPANFDRCGIDTAVATPFVAGAAGEYHFVDCFSMVAGSGTPYFTFAGTGGTTQVNIRRWAGGTNMTLDSNCVVSIEVVTGGGQTVVTGGASVEIRGIFREADVTLSGASVVRIAAVTGSVAVRGTAGTCRIYGVCGVVTDHSAAAVTIDNRAVSQDSVNAEMDTALNTAIPGSPTADSINQRIVALDAVVDPLLNLVPGAYASGTAGYVLGAINPANVTIVSPVATDGTAITLRYGDDYYNADGRALTFTALTGPVLTGGTVNLRIQAASVVSLAAVITGAHACYVEATAVQVASIGAGVWHYDLEATLVTTAHVVTLVAGTLVVEADVR